MLKIIMSKITKFFIRFKVRIKAIVRICSCNDFILIEAKKSNGKLLSRISYRTDFDDIDECRIFRKYYLKELNNLSYSDKRSLASERTIL